MESCKGVPQGSKNAEFVVTELNRGLEGIEGRGEAQVKVNKKNANNNLFTSNHLVIQRVRIM